jgi:DNA (cytosine-5)-methyltransferase 1
VKDGKRPTLISLFSGAGGLDYGLRKAGFDARLFVEICGQCCETLRRNFPGARVINRDIRFVTTKEMLAEAGLGPKEVTLVAGGPPCQPFSTLGDREIRANALEDSRGNLFYQFARVVRESLPEAFLMENVPGIVSAQRGKVLDAILEEFRGLGYYVNYKVLNSADYGVPQIRKRIVFVGKRENGPFNFPEPTHAESPNMRIDGRRIEKWMTVGEALETIKPEDRKKYRDLGLRHSQVMIEKMKMISPGGNFRTDLPRDLWPRCWSNGSHQGRDTFGRLEAAKPSVTIRTSGYNPTKGRYIHPSEHRGLTTLEMAVIQSFPKDYEFVGPLVEVGKQIGNAVPPRLAYHLGVALLEQLGYARQDSKAALMTPAA